jgi:hypothetical protein
VINIRKTEIDISIDSIAINLNLDPPVRVPEYGIYRGEIRDNTSLDKLLAASMIRSDRNTLTPHESFTCYETYNVICFITGKRFVGVSGYYDRCGSKSILLACSNLSRLVSE